MLRVLFWRSFLLVLGLLWLACAAGDVYRIATEGGVLVWTIGVVHFVFFLLLGIGTCIAAFLLEPDHARDMLIEFVRDVFSRRQLIEFAIYFGAAVLAAAVLVALHRRAG